MPPTPHLQCTRTVALAHLALLLALTPWGLAQCRQAATNRTIEEQSVQEAVLRSQMGNWCRNYDREDQEAAKRRGPEGPIDMNFRTFLVQISGRDPSAEFLKRFKDIPRKIKAGSNGRFDEKFYAGWLTDKDSHDRVIQFWVGQVEWVSEGNARTRGGYYCGVRCAAVYVFELKKFAGKWTVKSAELKVIS